MSRIAVLLLLLFPIVGFSQTAVVRGLVKESVTGETIPGATVSINNTYRAQTDIDGIFELKDIPYGTYTIVITVTDFDTLIEKLVVDKPQIEQDFEVGSIQLEEIKVIANLVTGHKTPIAVTNVGSEKITEELASRDIPMLLNATPGVYATQTGGGDGDSRITVRGFDQRNVGVLIDGVPVNDMENGWVYWSNWFGLDAITSNIQIQRGLGATKLAMPSVGGTLNIVTSGIGNKKGFSVKQEYGTGNLLRTSLSYNSGLMKNGLGVVFSGSYKQGDGWVYGTNTQGAFLYAKIQKKWDKHLLSFSAFAAPQKHGQRSFNQKIQYWDADIARDMGVPVDSAGIYNRGIRFNEHWGYRTVDGKKEVMNERLNYYNKPQITLKDFWTVNKKLSISNIAYLSIGRGGGTRLSNSGGILRTTDGLIDWDAIVTANQTDQLFGGPSIDPLYSDTELKSTQVLVSSVNNHFWAGYLGQFTYEINKKLSASGGVDYRFYKGTHYQEIRDILGGDYYINAADKNTASPMKREGDKISLNTYNNWRDGLVQWAGAFGQMEYEGTRWTAFLNLSGVSNSYKGIDYFQKKMLEVGDTVLRIGAEDTVTYQGQTYTASSEGLEYFHTNWKTLFGGTIKMGASFALTENATVFMNMGYLSRTPQFSNVIDNNTNSFFREILNEKILAVEAGYNYASNRFGVNVNGYATNWQNKPFPFGVSVPDPNDPTANVYVNINGMDAIHLGAEVDLAYKLSKKVSAEFMFSYGDWTWNSTQTITIPDLNNYTFTFDAKGVHVGDAAQTMANASIRYDITKEIYVKAQYQFFDRYYANFSPFALQGANARHEAYKLPSYGLLNFFAGYKHRFGKVNTYINGTITNALNAKYMADATDNFYAPMNFDAQSASVMFGQGFRFNIAVGIQF
jgi:iron complex outermembrane recepter protein